jgi:hypothetical protein
MTGQASYQVTTRGALPPDVAELVSRAHAAAIVARLAHPSPGEEDSVRPRSSAATGQAQPRQPADQGRRLHPKQSRPGRARPAAAGGEVA